MAGRLIQRGEIWRLDLGYHGKVRPVLVISIPFLDNERTLVSYIPRTTQVWGTRFEVSHNARNFLPGAFDVQSIGSAPSVSFVQKLANIDQATLELIEEKMRLSMKL
jgi:mRNA-degrading endonuclease toxin of MazEF toxin-antitoxin module